MTETSAPVAASSLRRGVFIFLVIAAAAALVVIAATASRDTLTGLRHLEWRWLAVTLGLWLVATVIDGARLSVISHIAGRPLSVFESAELILIGYFMAAVTPFQAGGLPLQLYLMNKRGIAPGEATAILLGRGLLYYAMVLLLGPLVALRLGMSSVLLRVVAGYAGVIVTVGTLVVLAGLVFPRVVERLAENLRSKPETRVRRFLVRLLAEFGKFLAALRLILGPGNRGRLLVAAVLTVAYGAAYFSMGATLLAGLGLPVHGFKVIGIGLLLSAVLISIPTPGSSGIAEAGAAALYSYICPKPMLGIYVVLWRLASFYLGAMFGGLVTIRRLARSGR